ncbi:MAG: nucleic acid-binding protein, partial [Candidatus Omnitrophota bacterium]
VTTILARGSHKQSVLAGEALFTSKIIKIAHVCPNYLQAAWELYQKYKDKMFSFTDVTSFVIMKDINIKKAFAFDREFVQAGIELIEWPG